MGKTGESRSRETQRVGDIRPTTTEYRDVLSALMNVGPGSEVRLAPREYRMLTAFLKEACRKADMKYSSGAVRYRNNRGVIQKVPFPETVEIYPLDDLGGGEAVGIWKNTAVLSMRYNKVRKTYDVKVVELIDRCDSTTICKRCEPERADAAKAFIQSYQEVLTRHSVAERPQWCRLLMPHMYFQSGQGLVHASPSWYDVVSADGSELLPKPLHLMESLTLAASLFSLIKPMFHVCGMDVDINFVLQLQPSKDLRERAAKEIRPQWPFWAIDNCVDLWCNFRPWNRRDKKFKAPNGDSIEKYLGLAMSVKMRNSWEKELVTAPWLHRGLPLVYSDRKRVSIDDEEITYYKSETQKISDRWIKLHKEGKMTALEAELAGYTEETERIREAVAFAAKEMDSPSNSLICHYISNKKIKELGRKPYLPILLPSERPPRSYPEKDCLTVELGGSNPVKIYNRMVDIFGNQHLRGIADARHAIIISFYESFVDSLEHVEVKTLRKRLKKAYYKALRDLGENKDCQDPKMQHKACLLSAIYFAKECLSARAIDAGVMDQYADTLLSVLGCEANVETFAQFVQEVLTPETGCSFYLFEQDDRWIYLKNSYWEGFCHFCKDHKIHPPKKRLEFLKSELLPKGYLRGGSPTQKYTFTKTINKKRTTICKISKDIFNRFPALPLVEETEGELTLAEYDNAVEAWRGLCGRGRAEIERALDRFRVAFCMNSANYDHVGINERLMTDVFYHGTPLMTQGARMINILAAYDTKESYERCLLAYWTREPLSVDLVCELQGLALKNTYSEKLKAAGEEPGTFRCGSVVPGDRQNTEPRMIKTEVYRLLENVAERPKGKALLAAADILVGMEAIRPFAAGNGRTARLMMNLYLLECGHPPIVVSYQDREAYENAMETWRATGRTNLLVEFLMDQTRKTWTFHLFRDSTKEAAR